MALIDDIKVLLRISNTAYNTEIADLILSAKADLELSGVNSEKILDTDTLIKRAISTYVKANFGLNNPDTEKLQRSYDMLKSHLSLSLDYSRYAITFSVTDNNTAVDEATIVFNGETKKTGAAGTVVFYAFKGYNYEYTVSKAGYVSQEDNVDVTASVTIDIALVVS